MTRRPGLAHLHGERRLRWQPPLTREISRGWNAPRFSQRYNSQKDAILLERRELTSGATWHAAGNVHTQSPYANLSALQAYSVRLYDGLAEEVGQEVGSHVVGGFFLAQTRERMEEFKHLAGKFRAIGLEYDLVTPSEIKSKSPLMNVSDLEGGAWDPEEGHVDPCSVTMGLAAGARKHRGKILRNTQVEGIARLPSGHWRLTSGEETFECEIVVNCAGFWADEIARMVGTRLPITNMEHQYLVTEAMPSVVALGHELPMIRDCDSQFYLRQEGQGLLLGPWERDCRRAWNETDGRAPLSFGQELFEDDWERLEDGLGAIFHRVPDLKTAGIKRGVNGAISFSPDGRPMIGPMPHVPGFFVACGFLGGIAQGGGIGLAMSQWILEGESELDLHFLDVARFGDWTTREFARERTHEIMPIRYEVTYPGIERKTGRTLKTCAGHMARAPGSVIYTAVLNARGTYESDITAQRIADDHYRLFVGTNAIKRDMAWFRRHSEGDEVMLTDSTEEFAVLGLMGPEARQVVAKCGAPELVDLGHFKTGLAQIAGHNVRAARMSYVGEAGWEITCKAENAAAIHAALVAAGARPAGMFAQTSMRIEKGFCAMGHELDGDISPIEAGLDFATRRSGGFIGFEAMQTRRSSGAVNHLVSLTLDDEAAVPLGHEPIHLDGEVVGQTSSCAFGYRVGKPVALGHVKAPVASGTQVQVDIAREMFDASITIGPLFDPTGARMRA